MQKWNSRTNLHQNKRLVLEAGSIPTPEDCPDWKDGVKKLQVEPQPRKYHNNKKQTYSKSNKPAFKSDLTARNYAAIDLGTNSCRLVIASPTPSSFKIVETFSKVTRLL